MRNSRVVYFGLAELVSCSSSLLHVRKVRVIQKSCASATEAEVEFVTPVTPGGSVKFLPAV